MEKCSFFYLEERRRKDSTQDMEPVSSLPYQDTQDRTL